MSDETKLDGNEQPQRFVYTDNTGKSRTVRDAAVNTVSDNVTGTSFSGTPGAASSSNNSNATATQTNTNAMNDSLNDSATGTGGDSSVANRASKYSDNNYESLDRSGRSSAQHFYTPVNTNSDNDDRAAALPQPTRPAAAASQQPARPATGQQPSRDHRNVDIHTCPLPASVKTSQRDVCVLQGFDSGAQGHNTNQAARRLACDDDTDGDDIIELRDVSGDPAADDGGGVRILDGKGKKKKGGKKEVKVKPSPVNNQNIPNTHFAIACMVAMCFNLPVGALAMYFSLKAVTAFQEGRPKLGQRRTRWSIILSLFGIMVTTCIVSSVVLYIASQGHKSITRSRAFGTKSGLNL